MTLLKLSVGGTIVLQPTLIQIGNFVFQVSDGISVVLLLAAIVGLAITMLQMRQGGKLQRATFLKELYLTLTSDEMLHALALVEYNAIHVNEDGDMSDRDREVQLNKLLGFANTVCMLWSMRLITARDLWDFHYFLARLYKHNDVRKYLVFLSNVEHSYSPTKRLTYPEFVVYCAKTLGFGPIEGLEKEIEAYRMWDDPATRGIA